MTQLSRFLATCAYIGYIPIAPGTFGSAAGVGLFALERWLGVSPVVELAVIVVLFAVGIWSAGVVERELGIDPGPVVLDEVVGMLMTLALLPVNTTGVIVAFVLFRILDVVKPWPAGRFERLHGGLGVMADDAMAGVYGNLAMLLLMRVFPGWLS